MSNLQSVPVVASRRRHSGFHRFGTRALRCGASAAVAGAAAIVGLGVATTPVGAVLPANPSTFTTPGAATFTVPTGVTSLDVVAVGGGGGGGNSFWAAGVGGAGAQVTVSALAVTPGETLTLFVGGGGGPAVGNFGGSGGGGSSSIDAGASNQIIAGGGGGAGASNVGGATGGDAGGSSGAGLPGADSGCGTGTGAGGGSAGNGGALGGAGTVCSPGAPGVAGGNGNSGNGGNGSTNTNGGLGGGGSGVGGTSGPYGGGGGGGYGGGGGGGSGAGGGAGGSVGPSATYATASNGGPIGTSGGDGSITISWTKATTTTTLATSGSPSTVGQSVTFTATIGNGNAPSGTVGFFADGSTTAIPGCDSANVSLVGSAYTASCMTSSLAVGPHSITASYSGDSSNTISSTTAGLPQVVQKASPTLSTQASSAVVQGAAVSDTATLTGGDGPTGTVTFNLYGPSAAASCTAGDRVTSVALSGTVSAGQASSGPVTPATAGTYYWVASYGGDTNNNTASPASCGATNESVVVYPGLRPSSSTLPPASSCAAYTQTFTTGAPGYTYVITGSIPPVPPGLTFTSGPSGATLSGRPTTAGSYGFRVTASAPGAPSVGRSYLLQVALCIDGGNPTLPAGTHGRAYSYQLAGSGGKAPYRFEMVSGSLPTGLSLSASGLISGTPSMPGTFSVKIEVLDSSSAVNTGTQTLTMTVS